MTWRSTHDDPPSHGQDIIIAQRNGRVRVVNLKEPTQRVGGQVMYTVFYPGQTKEHHPEDTPLDEALDADWWMPMPDHPDDQP